MTVLGICSIFRPVEEEQEEQTQQEEVRDAQEEATEDPKPEATVTLQERQHNEKLFIV